MSRAALARGKSQALVVCVCVAISLAAALGRSPRAQMRAIPVDEEQGHVALGLALRHLGNTGVFMMATAHPDDENNGLLVQLNRGQGYRTALATAWCSSASCSVRASSTPSCCAWS